MLKSSKYNLIHSFFANLFFLKQSQIQNIGPLTENEDGQGGHAKMDKWGRICETHEQGCTSGDIRFGGWLKQEDQKNKMRMDLPFVFVCVSFLI